MEAFLQELHWRLMFYLPPEQTKDILSDYREYFAAGLAEGKSEAALCAQFGSPREIARELTAGQKPVRLAGRAALLLMPWATLVLNGWFAHTGGLFDGGIAWLPIGWALLLAPLLSIFARRELPDWPLSRRLRRIALGAGILAAAGLVCAVGGIVAALQPFPPAWVYAAGPWLTGSLRVAATALALLWTLCMGGSTVPREAAGFLCGGGICALCLLGGVLHLLSDLDSLRALFLLCLLPLGIGALLGTAAFLILRRKRG